MSKYFSWIQGVASLTSTTDNTYAWSLRPVLFLMYMKLYASGLFEVADKHLTKIHTHANDTQLYVSFRPTSQTNADNTIEKCIVNVHNQMVN